MKTFNVVVADKRHAHKPTRVRAVNVETVVKKIKQGYVAAKPMLFHVTDNKGRLVYVGTTEKIGEFNPRSVKTETRSGIRTSWPQTRG